MTGPVEVQKVRRSGGRAGSVIAVALAGVVLVLSALGLAWAGDDGASPSSPGVAAGPSSPPVRTPSLLVTPRADWPPPPISGMPVTAGSGPGLALVAAYLGWPADCAPWTGFGSQGPATREELAAAAGRVPPEGGAATIPRAWGPPIAAWIGGDVGVAAAAWSASAAFAGSDGATWIVHPAGSVLRLRGEALPDGRTAWQVVDEAGVPPWCEPGATPTDEAVPVLVIDGPGDGANLVAQRSGWFGCTWSRSGSTARPEPARVDAAVGRATVETGWVTVDGRWRVWVGAGRDDLARAAGGRVVTDGAADAGDAWVIVEVGGASVAHRFARIETPSGRVAWWPTGDATGSCSRTRDATPRPDGPLATDGGASIPAVESPASVSPDPAPRSPATVPAP